MAFNSAAAKVELNKINESLIKRRGKTMSK